MHDLIIVESPNKVRDVLAYASAAGLSVEVEATSGHLLDLPPMKLGPGVDPDRFVPSALVPRDDAAAARVSRLKRAIASAARVIVATDADREGEAIAAQVWPWIPHGKAWRTAFEEITATGVRRCRVPSWVSTCSRSWTSSRARAGVALFVPQR